MEHTMRLGLHSPQKPSETLPLICPQSFRDITVSSGDSKPKIHTKTLTDSVDNPSIISNKLTHSVEGFLSFHVPNQTDTQTERQTDKQTTDTNGSRQSVERHLINSEGLLVAMVIGSRGGGGRWPWWETVCAAHRTRAASLSGHPLIKPSNTHVYSGQPGLWGSGQLSYMETH